MPVERKELNITGKYTPRSNKKMELVFRRPNEIKTFDFHFIWI